MLSVEKKIEKNIACKPRGKIILPSDFQSYGTSEAIRKALERLVNKGVINRVTHGIYVRPRISKYIGAVAPTAEEVADALVKRDRLRTIPTGSYALHALGLSTQIPMNIILLTDGSPREIKVGKRIITFKKTTPKNLLTKGKISRLVIQALKEIGIDSVDAGYEKKFLKLLEKENEKDLKNDICLAPVWIQNIMRKAIINGENKLLQN